MQQIFNSLLFVKRLAMSLLIIFLCVANARAESCTPPRNFEMVNYNPYKADFKWDFAQDASYYVLEIKINGIVYTKLILPGNATAAFVTFDPPLQNYDVIHAKLTKYCVNGGSSSDWTESIIITDGIVYISGEVQYGPPALVEPVIALNDNLIPNTNICGLCEPDFFRLNSGFYGPYGIQIDPDLGTIEQLRFLKSELCTCLNEAIAAGVLLPGGGQGTMEGRPFRCNLTPYMFVKQDCRRTNPDGGGDGGERKNEENNEPNHLATNSLLEVIPNPVTQTGHIEYTLNHPTTATITLHDMTGRLCKTLVDQIPQQAGTHQVPLDATDLSPGLYYCRLLDGTAVLTKTIVVMKP